MVGKDNLDITEEELDKLKEALKKEEFRTLLSEYAEELRDPVKRAQYEEELVQLESQRGVDMKFIKPDPGYVIKGFCSKKKEKVFINVCSCGEIDKPTFTVKEQNGQKGQQCSLPYSIAPMHREKDNKDEDCEVYDVVFNPEVLMRCGNPQFKEMVTDTALDAIINELKVELDKKDVKFPKMTFKGKAAESVIRRRVAEEEPQAFSHLPKRPNFPEMPGQKKEEDESKPKKPSDEPEYRIVYRDNVDMGNFTNDRVGNVRPSDIILYISLPLHSSAANVDLDVYTDQLELHSEYYNLVLNLPYGVDSDNGKAKFDKHKKELVVTLETLKKELPRTNGFAEQNGFEDITEVQPVPVLPDSHMASTNQSHQNESEHHIEKLNDLDLGKLENKLIEELSGGTPPAFVLSPEPTPQNNSQSETTPDQTSQNDSQSETIPDPTSQNDSQSETIPDITPQNDSQSETIPDPTLQDDSQSETIPNITPQNDSQSGRIPDITPQNDIQSEAIPDITPQNDSQSETIPDITPQHDIQSETIPDPTPQNDSQSELPFLVNNQSEPLIEDNKSIHLTDSMIQPEPISTTPQDHIQSESPISDSIQSESSIYLQDNTPLNRPDNLTLTDISLTIPDSPSPVSSSADTSSPDIDIPFPYPLIKHPSAYQSLETQLPNLPVNSLLSSAESTPSPVMNQLHVQAGITPPSSPSSPRLFKVAPVVSQCINMECKSDILCHDENCLNHIVNRESLRSPQGRTKTPDKLPDVYFTDEVMAQKVLLDEETVLDGIQWEEDDDCSSGLSGYTDATVDDINVQVRVYQDMVSATLLLDITLDNKPDVKVCGKKMWIEEGDDLSLYVLLPQNITSHTVTLSEHNVCIVLYKQHTALWSSLHIGHTKEEVFSYKFITEDNTARLVESFGDPWYEATEYKLSTQCKTSSESTCVEYTVESPQSDVMLIERSDSEELFLKGILKSPHSPPPLSPRCRKVSFNEEVETFVLPSKRSLKRKGRRKKKNSNSESDYSDGCESLPSPPSPGIHSPVFSSEFEMSNVHQNSCASANEMSRLKGSTVIDRSVPPTAEQNKENVLQSQQEVVKAMDPSGANCHKMLLTNSLIYELDD